MYSRRRRGYFILMGGCLLLFISAWAFVRLWSVPAAIGMCFVAMVIPPIAAMVGNRRGPEDRWWDDPPPGGPDKLGSSGEPPADRESEEWWDELDGRKRR